MNVVGLEPTTPVPKTGTLSIAQHVQKKTHKCSWRGSNPRLAAHKTATLPTELQEQKAHRRVRYITNALFPYILF